MAWHTQLTLEKLKFDRIGVELENLVVEIAEIAQTPV